VTAFRLKNDTKMLKIVYRIWFIVTAFVLASFALQGQNDSSLRKALEYEIKLKVLQDLQASKYLLLSQRADKWLFAINSGFRIFSR
jgi:hypothetical protein